MSLPYQHKLVRYARGLRKNATKQERHLWYDFLKNYPIRFQRQKAILGYIADFYCSAVKLIVELDGSQHYETPGAVSDAQRTDELEKLGITVQRFSNLEIEREFEAVCEQIDLVVKERIDRERKL